MLIQAKTLNVHSLILAESYPGVNAQMHWRMLEQKTSRSPFKGFTEPHQPYQDTC